ncbi:hypothetical protein LWT37_24325, partial [Enterobacter hormaechei]|nr:hypothetical protein [Enterobacter hormaechei]
LQLREHAADQLAGLALTLKELGERYPGDSAWILARYKALAGTFVLMHYKIKELLPLLGASLPNHKFDPNFDAIGWSLFDDIRRQLLP